MYDLRGAETQREVTYSFILFYVHLQELGKRQTIHKITITAPNMKLTGFQSFQNIAKTEPLDAVSN